MATTTPDALPYPILTDTPDVPRDIKALADRIQALRTADSAAWTDYAASLTATTTSPAGWTLTYAKWCQVGKLVHVRVRFAAGASFTAGSGIYLVSWPTPPVGGAGGYQTYDVLNGAGKAQAGATGAISPVSPSVYSGALALAKTSGVYLDNTGPGIAWVANSSIQFQACYERA